MVQVRRRPEYGHSREIEKGLKEEEEKSEQDEKILIEQAILGDREAFGKLYKKHENRLMAIAAKFDLGRAEDLLQDTLAKAWKNISNFRGDSSKFGAWLRQIMNNNVRDLARKDKVRRKKMSSINKIESRDTEMGDDIEVGDRIMAKHLKQFGGINAQSPEEIAISKQTLQKIKEYIDTLSETEQQVYQMSIVEKKTQYEIAAALKPSQPTINRIIKRISINIRKIIQE